MENNKTQQIDKEEDIDLARVVKSCLRTLRRQWKWFALSLVVCVAASYLYQKRQPEVFQRQSVVLIENAESGSPFSARRSSGTAMSSLLEMNGISVGDNLKNETFILTSKRLMKNVVDTLGLDVDYTTTWRLRPIALYKETPVRVRFKDRAAKAASFSMELRKDSTVMLHNFRVGPDRYAQTYEVQPGRTIATPAGVLTLERGETFNEFPRGQEVSVTHLPLMAAAALYSGKMSAAEYDKESSLIVLTCNDASAQRAEDVLDELYNAYMRDIVANKNRVAESTMRFIEDRSAIVGAELADAENRLANFKRSHKIVNFEQDAQAFVDESLDAHNRTLELETQKSVARFLAGFIADKSHDREVIPALPGLRDAAFTSAIGEYNSKMLQRNHLADNTHEEAAAIRDLDRQLASLRKAILASIDSYVSTIDVQLREAETNLAALTGQAGGLPDVEKLALGLERQQKLKSTLYTYLLNKREEVAMQLSIKEANIRLVEAPLGPPAPVSPRKMIILLVGIVLGLAIPAGVFWLIHLFDVSVSGRKDVENLTTIPLAGEIPLWNPKNESDLVTEGADSSHPVAEAFRLLRYGLNFMQRDARIFVVTSTTPAQGKSFISRNLAAIYAAAGKHVLLVDADIRKRTQSHLFGRSEGLTTYLVDTEDRTQLADIVIPDAVTAGVDFLPAGITPPNPSELLMSDRLDRLAREALDRYDLVIFDTTPVCSVADAAIVDRLADVTLYVIRVGVQEKTFLPELEKMYRDNKFRNLCIVLNDSDAKGQGAAYGYGYGYGSTGKQRKRGRLWRR